MADERQTSPEETKTRISPPLNSGSGGRSQAPKALRKTRFGLLGTDFDALHPCGQVEGIKASFGSRSDGENKKYPEIGSERLEERHSRMETNRSEWSRKRCDQKLPIFNSLGSNKERVMGCGGCKKKSQCPKKRKRLPSINPFFHFLKCVWRKFRGCKRSVVVRYAVKKWRRMSKSEKQPFFDAACRAQALQRSAKKDQCPKPKKSKCGKKKKKKCPQC